jgi:hypothetical protein
MKVIISRTAAATVLPAELAERWKWRATLNEYQGGDPVGYGKTPGEAVNDLVVVIELHGGNLNIETM